jgi:Ca2+-transporting ATPase
VAREAAALVLLKDDFSSLLAAVRQGRRVFANLRKAIVFVVAVHVPIVGLALLPVALGWPMLLAPVHVLFLQLIIDPACSLVFEAEGQEDHAMSAPPRAPQARLFDPILLRRGLAQGGGVLLLLLAVFALARFFGASDEAARALSFAALVLSNLALIQQNRRWGPQSADADGESGRKFGLMAVGVAGLLMAVLWMPRLGGLFGFAAPQPWHLPLALLAAAGSMAWCAAVKRWLPGSGY